MSTIFLIKKNAASKRPTSIATVRSTKTVIRNVTRNTQISDFCPFMSDFTAGKPAIFQETETSTAARTAIGMYTAYLPRNSMMSRSVTACTMPATGVRPPFLIFVAVRAIAPVAGMPPKIGLTMFATPCAISSIFESCFAPIIPSATTALSSDSIAPSTAIEIAEGNNSFIVEMLKSGSWGDGNVDGIEPYREPIVSQWNEVYLLIKIFANVPNIITMSDPGIFFVTLGHTNIITRHTAERINAYQFIVPIVCQYFT